MCAGGRYIPVAAAAVGTKKGQTTKALPFFVAQLTPLSPCGKVHVLDERALGARLALSVWPSYEI